VKRSSNLLRNGVLSIALVFAGMVSTPTSSHAATIELTVAGYYGGNLLANSSVLPAGTTVELGFFYSGGVFTTSSNVLSALASVATTSEWSNFRLNSGWVSCGSVSVGSNGDFNLVWSSLDTSSPGLGSEFDLNPTTGALASQNLVGKTPFLWVQTANSLESGLFVSRQTLPSAGFGVSFQIDATAGETGVTALRGTVTDSGLKTATLSAGTSSNNVVPTLRLLVAGLPSYSGGNTVITHSFAINANGSYVLEYKSSLADAWKTQNISVVNSNSFTVTLTNNGVNSTNDWKNRMFFRVKNG